METVETAPVPHAVLACALYGALPPLICTVVANCPPIPGKLIVEAGLGYGVEKNGTVTNDALKGATDDVGVGVGVGVGVAVGAGVGVGVAVAAGVGVGVAVAPPGVGVTVWAYGSELLLLLHPARIAAATPNARSVFFKL